MMNEFHMKKNVRFLGFIDLDFYKEKFKTEVKYV